MTASSRPPSTRAPIPTRLLAAVGAVVLAVAATVSGGAVAGASPATGATPARIRQAATPILSVASVSPWVLPDGQWTATFDTAGLPADAEVTYSIRSPISGNEETMRTALTRDWGATDLPPPLQAPVTKPVQSLLSGNQLVVTIPIRSSPGPLTRAFIPNAGIHPVLVVLSAADGTELQRLVVHLVRLPAAATRPLNLAVVAEAESPTPVVSVGRVVDLPDPTAATLSALAGAVNANQSFPVTLGFDPEAVEAAGATATPDAVRQALRTALANHPALRRTWTPVHLEGWASTGAAADLQTSLIAGDETLRAGGAALVDSREWMADATVGPASLPTLRSVGVDRVVVRADRLAGTREIGNDPGTSLSVQIAGASGSTATAMVVDPEIDRLLHDTASGTGLVVSRVLAHLAAVWFAAPTSSGTVPQRGLVLRIDGTVPSATATALIDALATQPASILRPTTLSGLFDAVGAYTVTTPGTSTSRRTTRPVVRALLPAVGTPDVRALSSRLGRLRIRQLGHDAIMGAAPSGAAGLDRLLLSVEHRGLSAAQATGYLDAVGHIIDADLAAIVTPGARTFNVTARSAKIPLSYTNNLNHPVQVLVKFRSTRLTFTAGNHQLVTLKPGITRLDVAVSVRTSGQFGLDVETESPNGALTLADTPLRIRSSAFSGIGVALSVGALLFLSVWWIRTLRRERRRRSADTATGR